MGRKAGGSNATDVYISVREQILLALKPGSMDSFQLYERIRDASNPMTKLLNEGLVERIGRGRGRDAFYCLTAQGRAAVPCRRKLFAPMVFEDAA